MLSSLFIHIEYNVCRKRKGKTQIRYVYFCLFYYEIASLYFHMFLTVLIRAEVCTICCVWVGQVRQEAGLGIWLNTHFAGTGNFICTPFCKTKTGYGHTDYDVDHVNMTQFCVSVVSFGRTEWRTYLLKCALIVEIVNFNLKNVFVVCGEDRTT